MGPRSTHHPPPTTHHRHAWGYWYHSWSGLTSDSALCRPGTRGVPCAGFSASHSSKLKVQGYIYRIHLSHTVLGVLFGVHRNVPMHPLPNSLKLSITSDYSTGLDVSRRRQQVRRQQVRRQQVRRSSATGNIWATGNTFTAHPFTAEAGSRSRAPL